MLYKKKYKIQQGFFYKFLMGGGLKISGPHRDKVRWGGNLQKKSDSSQNCPLNAKLGHFLLF